MEIEEMNQSQQPLVVGKNQIYDIPTEFHNQGKQLTLCKVPAHMGIKKMKKQTKQQNRQ